MHHAVALLLTLCQPSSLHPEFVARFTPLEYRYTGGHYHDEPFRYRLFVPGEQHLGPRPLLVWLHGYGENGDDNAYQLRWLEELVFQTRAGLDDAPFYLLAVQCPPTNAGWVRPAGSQAADDMINVMAAILDDVLQAFPVDRARVYLSGVSDGGTGCWQLAAHYPEYFAAVAPLASRGINARDVASLKPVPVWAFHSRHDQGAPVARVRSTVQALQRAGGQAHLTEIESDEHDCWTSAFLEHHVLDWLLAQRRGTPSVPPGQLPWAAAFRYQFDQWLGRPLAYAAAALGLLTAGVYLARRRAAGRRNSLVAAPGESTHSLPQ